MLEFEKIGLEDDNLGDDVDLDHGDEVGLGNEAAEGSL